jgi:hypothetical protein
MRDSDMTPGEVPKKWGDEQRKWHIEKTISYSDIISTLVMISAVLTMFISADRRIEANKATIETLARVQIENDRRQDDLRNRIEVSLGDINKKMDWMIDRLVEKKTRD